ncbi:hypothetical protein [Neisseria polysaccharea]|uniref:hypothetical protein n=1 Tax=Neisseria polysaccharea TaxID=489 RepID=UPI0027E1208B|nr:hypothetical protein [Neisseria polysaccharea]
MSDNLKNLLNGFAQFVGEKDKELKASLTLNIETAKNGAVESAATAADAKIATAKAEVKQELQSAYRAEIATLKTELVGGASEELDTFKELADELAKLKTDGSDAPAAVLAKVTEVKTLAEGVRAELDAVSLEEMKQKFEAAFNG